VVYEALTGKHPFGSKSAVEARFRDLKVAPVPGLNPQQNALLASALSFDRKLRLDSIAMLVQAFALNDEPIIPMRDVLRPRRTDARSPEASVDRRRNWGLAVLAAVSAAGLVYYLASHRTQRDEASVPVAATGPTSNPAAGTAPQGTAATDAREEQAARPGVVKGKTPVVAKTAVPPGPQSPAIASNLADARSGNAAASGSTTRARAQGTTQDPAGTAASAAMAGPGTADAATGTAAATPDAGARSLYRWVDQQGNVQFGETPPAEYADVAVKVVDL
jgi:hypothetical protein